MNYKFEFIFNSIHFFLSVKDFLSYLVSKGMYKNFFSDSSKQEETIKEIKSLYEYGFFEPSSYDLYLYYILNGSL